MKFLLGKKIGMSQLFDERGNVIPVTWIEAGPCFITQVKTREKNNYEAIQFGVKKKAKKIKKTEKGKEFRWLREIRGSREQTENKELKVGDKIDTSIFKEGDIIKISGVSKAKGFQGVVKRWGFHGAPKTHGTKHALRKGGSIGSTDSARVFKGRKMAGRMGGKRVTIKNLKIVKIDEDKNLIGIKGAIPGRRGTLLEVKTMNNEQ